jgi:hypothetical protein
VIVGGEASTAPRIIHVVMSLQNLNLLVNNYRFLKEVNNCYTNRNMLHLSLSTEI